MRLSRREALAGAVALTAAPAFAAQSFFRSHRLPIGLQLYSVGAELKRDLEGTLAAVAAIGYRTVETAGYAGRTPQALRAAFDAHGLSCTSAHVQAKGNGPEPTLSGDLGRLAADMHVLGARHVVLPSFLMPDRFSVTKGEGIGDFLRRVGSGLTADDWKACAAFLDKVGAGLKREGLQLAYHNHNPEFAPVGGTTGLDILLSTTDPTLVQFEMDAGWVAAAGRDPVALLNAHRGRFTMMHVKDVTREIAPNFDFKVRTAEVGKGVMDWPQILKVAYAEGVREFFVEHEPPFTIPVLEQLKVSFENLSKMPA